MVLRCARETRSVWSWGHIVTFLTTHNFTFQENTMKSLQRLCGTAALALAFNLSVLAGDMHFPVVDPPPPPPSASTEGEILTPPASSEAGAVDPTVEIALSMLQSVLGLF